MFTNYRQNYMNKLEIYKKNETQRRIQFVYRSYESFYQPMLEEMGTIELQDNELGFDRRDGEGKTRAVISTGDKFGLLTLSWGNDYSEPDEIDNCKDFVSIKNLKEKLSDSIAWFDSIDELQTDIEKKFCDNAWCDDLTSEAYAFYQDVLICTLLPTREI